MNELTYALVITWVMMGTGCRGKSAPAPAPAASAPPPVVVTPTTTPDAAGPTTRLQPKKRYVKDIVMPTKLEQPVQKPRVDDGLAGPASADPAAASAPAHHDDDRLQLAPPPPPFQPPDPNDTRPGGVISK